MAGADRACSSNIQFCKEILTMASNNQGNQGGKSNRGFASMDPQRQREIASEGGRAAHEKGTAHEFTSEEAREAGRKGGMARSANRRNASNSSGSSSSSSHASGSNSMGGGSSGGSHGGSQGSSSGSHGDGES
jgi:general stress protein YciG